MRGRAGLGQLEQPCQGLGCPPTQFGSSLDPYDLGLELWLDNPHDKHGFVGRGKAQDILRNLPKWFSWVLGSDCGLFLGTAFLTPMRKWEFYKME